MLKVVFRGWVVLAALLFAACGKSGEGAGPSSPASNQPVEPAAAAPVEEATSSTPVPTAQGWLNSEVAALLRFLDTRQGVTKPRERAMLVSELNALELLVDTAPKDSPDRVRLVHRIAEDYVELRTAAMRDEPQLSGSEAEKARGQIAGARTQAIAHYELILDAYPSYGSRDDVFFGLAMEYGWNGDPKRLRENLFYVIREAPRSRHVPAAYFVFGEMFYAEAVTDPSKKSLAVGAFREAARDPSPANRVRCLSRERLARLAGSPLAPSGPINYDEAAACALNIPDPQGTDETLLSE